MNVTSFVCLLFAGQVEHTELFTHLAAVAGNAADESREKTMIHN